MTTKTSHPQTRARNHRKAVAAPAAMPVPARVYVGAGLIHTLRRVGPVLFRWARRRATWALVVGLLAGLAFGYALVALTLFLAIWVGGAAATAILAVVFAGLALGLH